jgi:hypothetical protein
VPFFCPVASVPAAGRKGDAGQLAVVEVELGLQRPAGGTRRIGTMDFGEARQHRSRAGKPKHIGLIALNRAAEDVEVGQLELTDLVRLEIAEQDALPGCRGHRATVRRDAAPADLALGAEGPVRQSPCVGPQADHAAPIAAASHRPSGPKARH